MRAHALVLAAAVVPALAVAAPVPKETEAEKVRRVYGTPVDPDKDCAFTLSGDKLVIRTPAAGHTFAFGNGLGTAPRVTRAVEGDFVATVRVRLAPPREPEPGGPPLLFQAGLFLAAGDQDFVYHARAVETQRGAVRRTGRHGSVVGGNQGSGGSSAGGAFDPETTYLRVTRTGAKTTFAASDGGTGWHEFNGPDADYAGKATLGLFVANPAALPFAAEFDEFTVTPLPPPGGKK